MCWIALVLDWHWRGQLVSSFGTYLLWRLYNPCYRPVSNCLLMRVIELTLLSVCLFVLARQPPSEPGPPYSRGLHITPNDAPQSVGLLWTSDQPLAESSTWQHATLTTDIHAPRGIRTHNLSKRAAKDLHLRARGHWDRQHFCSEIISCKIDNSAILMWCIGLTRGSVSGLLTPLCVAGNFGKIISACEQHNVLHKEWRINKYCYT